MADNIVLLTPRGATGVTEALREAAEAGMVECVTLGTGSDGSFILRSSGISNRDALWLAEKLRRWALGD